MIDPAGKNRFPVRTPIAAASAVLGVFTIVGWHFYRPLLADLSPGRIVMAPSSALAISFVSVALLLRNVERARRISIALASAASLMGVLGVISNLRNAPEIDARLTSAILRIHLPAAAARMAPGTAVSVLALGAAIFLAWRKPVPIWASACAFIAAFPAAAILVSYSYDLQQAAAGDRPLMAFDTAVALILCAACVWSFRDEKCALRVVRANGPGGSIARWLIPAAFAIPFILGLPRLVEFRQHLFGPLLSISVGQIEVAALFLGAVLWAAVAIDRSDAERRRIEMELRVSEDRYRIIVDGAAEGIWVANGSSETTLINPRMAEMLGYSIDELRTLPFTSYLKHEGEPFLREIRERRRSGHVDRYDVELIRKDGSTFWARVAANPMFSPAGEYLGSLALISDISASKETQIALIDAYEREREAGERLRAVDEMKDQFLAAVSHELRTPLTGVLGFAATLHHRAIDLTQEERDEIAARLFKNAERLERLLADLLDLDRLRRGIIQPQRRSVDVARLIRGIAEFTELADHPLTIEVESGLEAFVDGPKVERIVENLLINAVRHTTAGTRIWVRAERLDDGILLCVDDEGSGVPTSQKDAIFEPFVTRAAPDHHSPGTGIGLSLVARFAALHGGKAWVEDRAGGGSSFRVFLSNHDDVIDAGDVVRPMRKPTGGRMRSARIAQ